MTRHVLTWTLLAASLAACATVETGVKDPARFAEIAERSTVESPHLMADFARCFRERASLYPGATILPTADGAGVDYELRVAGYTFEAIRFRSSANGSTATVELAPGVNDRWRRDMDRERLAPLKTCAQA